MSTTEAVAYTTDNQSPGIYHYVAEGSPSDRCNDEASIGMSHRSESPSRLIGARGLQIALGTMWLIDGLLQLQPHMFTDSFVSQVLLPAAQGQPGWVSWILGGNAQLVSVHVAAWNAVFALVQILIGVGLIIKETVKPALILSIGWSLGVWALGEGFGMMLTGHASPLSGAPGAVLLYGLIGLFAWPRRSQLPAPANGILLGSADRESAEHPIRHRWIQAGGGLRTAWVALWSLFAILWLLPANTARGAIGATITSASSGEPSWLSHMLGATGRLFASSGMLDCVVLAIGSVVIGFGPLVCRRATPFLVAGASVSLVFWVFGQAFGGILAGPIAGTATDPNTGPLVALMALALVPYRAKATSLAEGGARIWR